MFFGAFSRARPVSPWHNREPIREELFSVERLEHHARSLAVAQKVTSKSSRGLPLAGQLADNARVLLDAYRSITREVAKGRAITPAAEWLIDNYHLVEKQIHEIRTDLPPGYYRQLPKLAEGPFSGYPRVFGVAWAFIAHTDSCFEPELLRRFVRAYQEIQPLTIGELWAIAITLKIVLIENLTRLAEQIMRYTTARQEADALADRLFGAARTHRRADIGGVCEGRAHADVGRACGPTGAQIARPGSEDYPRTGLARRTSGGTENDHRSGGARRTSKARRRERHGTQYHHQYAPDLRHRLDGIVREHEPRRRRARRRQRL